MIPSHAHVKRSPGVQAELLPTKTGPLYRLEKGALSSFADAALARVLGLARRVGTGPQPSPAPQFELNSHCGWGSGVNQEAFPAGSKSTPEWGFTAELRKSTA